MMLKSLPNKEWVLYAKAASHEVRSVPQGLLTVSRMLTEFCHDVLDAEIRAVNQIQCFGPFYWFAYVRADDWKMP